MKHGQSRGPADDKGKARQKGANEAALMKDSKQSTKEGSRNANAPDKSSTYSQQQHAEESATIHCNNMLPKPTVSTLFQTEEVMPGYETSLTRRAWESAADVPPTNAAPQKPAEESEDTERRSGGRSLWQAMKKPLRAITKRFRKDKKFKSPAAPLCSDVTFSSRSNGPKKRNDRQDRRSKKQEPFFTSPLFRSCNSSMRLTCPASASRERLERCGKNKPSPITNKLRRELLIKV